MTTTSPKTFELGVYTFGNTPRTADGGYGPTAQAIRDALDAVWVAEAVGLDVFGFGEHHTRSMPVSSPTALVAAAAAATRTIRLGTTVSVLSTDEPIRVFQQLATAAALAPADIEAAGWRRRYPLSHERQVRAPVTAQGFAGRTAAIPVVHTMRGVPPAVGTP
jgi:hypothetical protein